jgi:cold shock CspA family protein
MIATITAWNFPRGFGFCQTENGKDYFIHIRHWMEEDPPAIGRKISFDVAPPIAAGKAAMAVNVRFVSDSNVSVGVDALKGGVE